MLDPSPATRAQDDRTIDATINPGSDTVTSTAAVRDLGGGLIVRQANAGDVEGIIASHTEGFWWPNQTEPSPRFQQWIRELNDRSHPSVSAEDTVVAEDTATGKIV